MSWVACSKPVRSRIFSSGAAFLGAEASKTSNVASCAFGIAAPTDRLSASRTFLAKLTSRNSTFCAEAKLNQLLKLTIINTIV